MLCLGARDRAAGASRTLTDPAWAMAVPASWAPKGLLVVSSLEGEAGQHSRGAMGSPLLAWGAEQAALCWANLLVLIWSIQVFLPAVAACYLAFSAGFSVWVLCPFPAVAHS